MLYVFLSLSSFAFGDALLPQVPEGVQAMSLLGEPLVSAEPSVNTLNNLSQARTEYEAEPGIAENIIWYGRRTAYAGDYRRAIEIFTEGVKKFPRIPGSSGIAAIVIFPSASSIMPLPIWSGRRI